MTASFWKIISEILSYGNSYHPRQTGYRACISTNTFFFFKLQVLDQFFVQRFDLLEIFINIQVLKKCFAPPCKDKKKHNGFSLRNALEGAEVFEKPTLEV